MRQPITPRIGEDVRAEHLRSHSQAIEWLYSRVTSKTKKYLVDSESQSFDGNYAFLLDTRPINGVKSSIIRGGKVYAQTGRFSSTRIEVVIPNFVINLSVPLVKYLWIKINAVAKFESAPYAGIFGCGMSSAYQSIPGISIGDSCPDGLAPNGVTGIGYHIQPLGRLTVESGEARFEYLRFADINLYQDRGNFFCKRF